jgi:recombination endonuclease VII
MTDQSIPHKTCSKCKIPKPVTAFRKRNQTTQQHLLMSWCKACRSEYNRAYQKSEHAQALHAKYKDSYRQREPVTERACNKCKAVKPASAFYANRGTSHGLNSDCIDCRRAATQSQEGRKYRREYAAWTNSKEHARERRRNWRLKKQFGITSAEYDEMFVAQNGGCAICGQQDSVRALHIDHDYKTKKVRALLCSRHNLGIGYFHDSIEELQTAIEYLRKHKT